MCDNTYQFPIKGEVEPISPENPYIVIVLGNKHWEKIYCKDNDDRYDYIESRFITINLDVLSKPFSPKKHAGIEQMKQEIE
jgi:hypothetical protein